MKIDYMRQGKIAWVSYKIVSDRKVIKKVVNLLKANEALFLVC